MVFSVAALAWTEKDRGLTKILGKLDETCWESPFWKKGDLEEAKEDLMGGRKVGEGVVLAWLKSWRGVKKVVEKAMEAICGG